MICIVIPTYNEAENIEELVHRLFLHLPEASILVVDDNSPDGTAERVQCLAVPTVSLLKREKKTGLGTAYQEGFRKALEMGAKRIVQMDADFSHDPAELPRMINTSADLVVGSRYIPDGQIIGWNLWRKFCSRGAMMAARLVLRLPTKDVTSGYRVWDGELIERILQKEITSNGYAFQEEMLFHAHKLSNSIKEVPVTFVDRREGQSKLSWKDVVEFFYLLIRLR